MGVNPLFAQSELLILPKYRDRIAQARETRDSALVKNKAAFLIQTFVVGLFAGMLVGGSLIATSGVLTSNTLFFYGGLALGVSFFITGLVVGIRAKNRLDNQAEGRFASVLKKEVGYDEILGVMLDDQTTESVICSFICQLKGTYFAEFVRVAASKITGTFMPQKKMILSRLVFSKEFIVLESSTRLELLELFLKQKGGYEKILDAMLDDQTTESEIHGFIDLLRGTYFAEFVRAAIPKITKMSSPQEKAILSCVIAHKYFVTLIPTVQLELREYLPQKELDEFVDKLSLVQYQTFANHVIAIHLFGLKFRKIAKAIASSKHVVILTFFHQRRLMKHVDQSTANVILNRLRFVYYEQFVREALKAYAKSTETPCLNILNAIISSGFFSKLTSAQQKNLSVYKRKLSEEFIPQIGGQMSKQQKKDAKPVSGHKKMPSIQNGKSVWGFVKSFFNSGKKTSEESIV